MESANGQHGMGRPRLLLLLLRAHHPQSVSRVTWPGSD